MTPDVFAEAAAGAWVLSWIAAAGWSKATARAKGGFGLYAIPQYLGGLMIYAPRPDRSAEPQLWSLPPAAAWSFAAVSVAGIAFSWWARLHLGSLWSVRTEVKGDHRIVDSGPYGLVRHPIYTGILLMALGPTVIRGDVAAVVGWGLLLAGFWLKARREERFLSEELGPGAYADYARRVKMLVPFLV